MKGFLVPISAKCAGPWSAARVRGALRDIGRGLLYLTSATWYRRECGAPTARGDPQPGATGQGPGVGGPEPGVAAAEIVLDAPEATFAALPDEDRHPQLVRAALEHHHLLAHAALGGRIVAYLLVGIGRVYVHDYRQCLALPPDAAFIYDTFVARELRGRRLAGRLVEASLEALAARGVERVFCHIPDWNRASQKAYQRLGFKPVGRVTYARVAGVGFFIAGPHRLLRPG